MEATRPRIFSSEVAFRILSLLTPFALVVLRSLLPLSLQPQRVTSCVMILLWAAWGLIGFPLAFAFGDSSAAGGDFGLAFAFAFGDASAAGSG